MVTVGNERQRQRMLSALERGLFALPLALINLAGLTGAREGFT